MRNKKSQMQIMESIIVLFIFFIIFILGFVFYTKVFMKSAGETMREQSELRAIGKAHMASDMPELQCTRGGEVDVSCVDKWKLDVVSSKYVKEDDVEFKNPDSLIEKSESYYSDIFGYSEITVIQVYPEPDPDADTPKIINWTIYSKKPDKYLKKTPINIPVIIYDPTADGSCEIIGRGSCSFGWLNVVSYD